MQWKSLLPSQRQQQTTPSQSRKTLHLHGAGNVMAVHHFTRCTSVQNTALMGVRMEIARRLYVKDRIKTAPSFWTWPRCRSWWIEPSDANLDAVRVFTKTGERGGSGRSPLFTARRWLARAATRQ